MRLEYSTLNGTEKYVASFNYSSVSSTPQFSLEVYRGYTNKGGYEAEPLHHLSCQGEAAVAAIRECIDACLKYTTLHDRSPMPIE